MKTDNIFRTQTLEVLMTNKCNFRCKYCFLGNEHVGSDANLKFVKTYLEANGNQEFYTFGGEPLVNIKGIIELVEFVESNPNIRHKEAILQSMRMVTTNGTLIKKNLDLIKKYKLRFQISLDGDKKGNSQRVYANGKSTFEDVQEAIQICLDNNIEFETHGVLDMVNAPRYLEIIKFLFELHLDKLKDIDKTIAYFNHNFSMMIMEGEYTDKFIDIFLEQLEKTTQWIIQLPITATQKKTLFENIIIRKNAYGVCGASTGLKVSDEAGNIYPCHRTQGVDSLSLGSFMDASNLKNEAIYNAWSDQKRFGFMYSVENTKLEVKVKSDEPWTYWCPACNYEQGDIFYINPKYVIMNKEISNFTKYLIEKYKCL